jgi:hypothetical protein
VAPARTGTLQRLAAPRGVIAEALGGALGTFSPNLLAQLRALWEASNHRWNQWVLNYTPSQQLQLLRDLGFDSPDWQDLLRLLVGALVLGSLVGAAWMLRERLPQDPWLDLLNRTRRKCARLGIELPANAPPRTMAQLLRDHAMLPPDLQRALEQWLLEMETLRYGTPDSAKSQRAQLKGLKMAWRRLPWPP